MAIRIEIAKRKKGDFWDIRVGDLDGGTESINVSKKEILKEVEENMKLLEKSKGEGGKDD